MFKNPYKGKFIIFEELGGCGKSIEEVHRQIVEKLKLLNYA